MPCNHQSICNPSSLRWTFGIARIKLLMMMMRFVQFSVTGTFLQPLALVGTLSATDHCKEEHDHHNYPQHHLHHHKHHQQCSNLVTATLDFRSKVWPRSFLQNANRIRLPMDKSTIYQAKHTKRFKLNTAEIFLIVHPVIAEHEKSKCEC